MDRQDQRKRAFSQAFQRINQPRLDVQSAKRVLSYSLGSAGSYGYDTNQEIVRSEDLDAVFDQITGTQLRHPRPADLQYASPAPYNYASLQYKLYGKGPVLELMSGTVAMPPPVACKRPFKGPILRGPIPPTPQFVRGKSMFGPSPYIRSDSGSGSSLGDILDSYAQSGSGFPIYVDEDSSMNDAITAVGPLTPSALNFGDLSLGSQDSSLPSSPLQQNSHRSRASVRVMSKSSFAGLFSEFNPNEVVILFNRGREARKVDKYPLSIASRFFAELLDGPFPDPSLTRCIRLRDDFPYAITTMLHFIETSHYMYDPRAFENYPLLTTLDYQVHTYLVANKYDIPALQDCTINAYLAIAEDEMKLGLMALSSIWPSDIQFDVPELPTMSPTDKHIDGEPMMTPIDRFLNPLVLLWKNTHTPYDPMRRAVLELIKCELSKLLRVPFFVTLMTEMVGFGDDIVASLENDGLEVKAFQNLAGARQRNAIRFGEQ